MPVVVCVGREASIRLDTEMLSDPEPTSSTLHSKHNAEMRAAGGGWEEKHFLQTPPHYFVPKRTETDLLRRTGVIDVALPMDTDALKKMMDAFPKDAPP